MEEELILPLEFPYRKFFYPSKEDLFKILQNDDVSKRIISHFYYLRGRVLSNPPLWDNLFLGKYIYIVATENTSKADELSDYYLEHIRLQTHRNNSRSVLDYYFDPNLRQEFIREHLKRYPNKSLKLEDLRETLYHLTFESKQFRPSWGRGIIKAIYPREKGLKMLDMSAGWGDRLITALSLGDVISSYTGYDPNINLKEGHDQIISDFAKISGVTAEIIYSPFEKASLPDNTYDFLLSSPPFFDVEIYPGGDQSIKNYPTLELWLRKFLFVSLDKAWKALKNNGYLIIHLSDVYDYTSSDGKKGSLKLIDPLNLYIEKYLPFSSWVGCIGLTSSDGISEGKKAKCWPVWIWKKVSSDKDVKRWKKNISRNLTMFVSQSTLFEKFIDDHANDTYTTELNPNEIIDERGITNYLLACYQKNLPLIAAFRKKEECIRTDKLGNSDVSYYFH